MRELEMSDGEIQALVATAIRAKLKAAGFTMGATDDADAVEGPGAFYFPINLNLAGDCTVTRAEDGTWTITQEDNPLLADRTASAFQSHAAAIERRESANRET